MAKMTRKGMLSSLISTMVLLGAIFVFCSIYVKHFFYGGVQQFVDSQFALIDGFFMQIATESQRCREEKMLEWIRNFSESSKMELLLLGDNKQIKGASSGFEFESLYGLSNKKTMIDDNVYITMLGPQKIMVFEHDLGPDDGYVMAWVLIDEINKEMSTILGVLFLIMALVLIFVVVANTYFTDSIVNTIWTINRTANKIAKGDFRTRIVKRSNDEIGDLCAVINNMAEELSATETMKNEFISSVSHELRTPLTAIMGWAETITVCGLDDDLETFEKGMKIIASETERLSRMVAELLDFSKFQNTNTTLERKEIKLLRLVNETVWIFKERAVKEEKRLVFKYDEHNDVLVLADANRLKQVLINVLDNALKYTDANGLVSIIAAEENIDGARYAAIRVTDNGCGIKKEDLKQVKTRFFKANYTRRGSGIGLAVADGVVALHDGYLNVDSVENEGTTVEILLPIYERRGA
ncbi:MAG: HAMP domain-containing histidine kinase [Oscillospiraceae bacterium]|jgi:signal transduction histidine kinase|nr:HAMP domain-containing histidine kinase [Oscillospiraceae bacterium]